MNRTATQQGTQANEIFAAPALRAISYIADDPQRILNCMETMFKDAFLYGWRNCNEDYNTLDYSTREIILVLKQWVADIAALARKYRWKFAEGREIIIKPVDAEIIEHVFEVVGYDKLTCATILEEMMIVTILYKWGGDRPTDPDLLTDTYCAYTIIRDVVLHYISRKERTETLEKAA